MPKGAKHGGRQKGTPNKSTGELRELLKQLVSEGITSEFMHSLTAEKRADLLVRLLPYALSKYADTPPDTGDKDDAPQVIINWASPES